MCNCDCWTCDDGSVCGDMGSLDVGGDGNGNDDDNDDNDGDEGGDYGGCSGCADCGERDSNEF
jgi:hypothetical protein